MLSEAVLASPAPDNHAPGFSVTQISPCAYATYLNYHRIDKKEFSGGIHLVLEDGNWQEDQMVAQLKRAGFEMRYTGSDQLEVLVGKAKVPGHPDGLITTSGFENMLEIKAMHQFRFNNLNATQLKTEPGIMCQVQCYMTELSVFGTWVYYKHKDACTPKDFFVEKDETYSRPIIQASDEIILGGYEPKKELCDHCVYCKHQKYCWETPIIDATNVFEEYSQDEVVAKWLKGKAFKNLGKELYDESRVILAAMMPEGSNEALISGSADGYDLTIKVSKSNSERHSFNALKFSKLYGAENLHKVMDTSIVEKLNTREVQ